MISTLKFHKQKVLKSISNDPSNPTKSIGIRNQLFIRL